MSVKLLLLAAPLVAAQSCIAVPLEKCGTELSNSCLACGTSSSFDCEKCCPGCSQVIKDEYKYCTCDGPGNDSRQNYRVADMDIISITGGPIASDYEKVVILLHGGGGSGNDWLFNYQQGWFGDMTGLKFVLPTSPLPGGVWYNSYKDPACGLVDECAYDLPSIDHTSSSVAALIEHEKQLIGNDNSKVFLAGFSQGAQMTNFMQLVKLDFALGGAVVWSGFPLPPLGYMPGADPAAAKRNASYYGQDMSWMFWIGSRDLIFPATYTMDTYHGIFEALGVRDTILSENIEPGQGHTIQKEQFDQLAKLVRG